MKKDTKYSLALSAAEREALGYQQRIPQYFERLAAKADNCPNARIHKTTSGTLYGIPCNQCEECREFEQKKGASHV